MYVSFSSFPNCSIYTSINRVWEVQLLYILTNIWNCLSFHFSHSEWCAHCSFAQLCWYLDASPIALFLKHYITESDCYWFLFHCVIKFHLPFESEVLLVLCHMNKIIAVFNSSSNSLQSLMNKVTTYQSNILVLNQWWKF